MDELKDVLGKPSWHYDLIERKGKKDGEDQPSVYELMVAKYLHAAMGTPELLRKALEVAEPSSAWGFSYHLAQTPHWETMLDLVVEFLNASTELDFVCGFMVGLDQADVDLPTQIVEALDEQGLDPSYAVRATLLGDIRNWKRGYDRVMKLAPALNGRALWSMFDFCRGVWPKKLRSKERAEVIGLIAEKAANGDPEASAFGLNLLSMWKPKRSSDDPKSAMHFSPEISRHALVVLEAVVNQDRVEEYHWKKVASLINPDCFVEHIAVVSRILLGRHFQLRDVSLGALIELARDHPEEVMKSLGSLAFVESTKPYFFYRRFRGLLRTIGDQVVMDWVQENGTTAAVAIARHVDSPAPTPEEPDHLPKLTKWLLEEYGEDDDVFAEFIAGRHHGETGIVVPEAMLSAGKTAEDKYGPYLEHANQRVRQWAEYEISSAHSQVKFAKHLLKDEEERNE
ncbi:hypothetical protein IIA16_06835 [bacterium]|nr:hypothetical protein [bacterium]